MEHYCCYSVFTNATQAERTSDIVEFFPQKLKVTFFSANDFAIQAASELVQVHQRPQPANLFSQVSNQQLEALQQLADIFQNTTNKVASEIPRVPVPVIPVVTSPPRRVPTASCSQLLRVEVSS